MGVIAWISLRGLRGSSPLLLSVDLCLLSVPCDTSVLFFRIQRPQLEILQGAIQIPYEALSPISLCTMLLEHNPYGLRLWIGGRSHPLINSMPIFFPVSVTAAILCCMADFCAQHVLLLIIYDASFSLLIPRPHGSLTRRRPSAAAVILCFFAHLGLHKSITISSI